MRIFITNMLVIFVIMLLGACGGDSNSVNPITTTETGSTSLLVNAEVNGSDEGAGLFKTDFKVTVTDSLSAAVNDAVVTIKHSNLGIIIIDWDTQQPGVYTASVSGYQPGTYTLNVSRGTDFITNGRVVGPDIHTITFPTLTDTLQLDTAFTVLWDRQSAADIVEIETRDYGPILSTDVGATDDGSFDISPSPTVRDDQFVRITRSNVVTLTKGLAGSEFEANIRNSVEPLVVM